MTVQNDRRRRLSSSLLLIVLLCGACPPVEALPEDAQGSVWKPTGSGGIFFDSGNVGIGNEQPMAKLDVRGRLYVDEDASLFSQCHKVNLDDPAAGDLGTQLQPLLGKFRCVQVLLKNGTTWTWNERVTVSEGQALTIEAEGFNDAPTHRTATISMTQNRRVAEGANVYRDVGRLTVARRGLFNIAGVVIAESANDTRPLATHPTQAALFTGYQFSELNFYACSITSSEDIADVGDHGFSFFTFTTLSISKAAGSPRDILVAKIPLWGFGFVTDVYTSKGTGVTYQIKPSLSVSSGP